MRNTNDISLSLLRHISTHLFLGVLLAIIELAGALDPADETKDETASIPAGTVSAGYQNFLICIEMFFCAIGLRYAFPFDVYMEKQGLGSSNMQVN